MNSMMRNGSTKFVSRTLLTILAAGLAVGLGWLCVDSAAAKSKTKDKPILAGAGEEDPHAKAGLGHVGTKADPNDPDSPTVDEPAAPAKSGTWDLSVENRELYTQLKAQIADPAVFRKTAATARRHEALILPADRDPADVILRRTEALLVDMKDDHPSLDISAAEAQLKALKARVAQTDVKDSVARQALFNDLCAIRRKIAFSNPLLNFDRILFVKHNRSRVGHMCDQYFGNTAVPGGGLYILSDVWGSSPRVIDVLANSVVESGRLKGQKLTNGSLLGPSLSYDGKTVLFAFTEAKGKGWTPETTYHIFKVNVDGSHLVQLTDGAWNDIHPQWMPNGRVVFISERRGGFGRCHGRPVPTYTLFSMNADGSDITCLSYHETNEWQPSITNDGMIVFSRWDYVDRDSDIAHHPWITSPDGRDSRAVHGNFPVAPTGRNDRPWMELDVRAIPGSHRFIATAAPHHGQCYGSFVLVDPDVEDDNAMAPLERITPENLFPESEKGQELYGTAWPLSEDYYLCVYGRDKKNYGIYLLDSFGNREAIYRDPSIACLSPIPLRPVTPPPVVPSPIREARLAAASARSEASPADVSANEALVCVVNAYDGMKPWPAGEKITALRIIQLYPKATPNADVPRIGAGAQSLARAVLGTVPVESDGSAYFRAPAGKPVYFQALDSRGLAVQSMRSLTYLQGGQVLTCQGCHEHRSRAPERPAQVPLALHRAPSVIMPDVDGSSPVSFARLVQPVLDHNCVACHQKNKGKAPDLSGDIAKKYGWSNAYANLTAKYAYYHSGGNGAIRDPQHGGSESTPGQFGAMGSKLWKQLNAGHKDVKLSQSDLHRITLWLDCNSVFYGAYDRLEEQARGALVKPALE